MIENLKYQTVIISPEQLMKPGGEFEHLLQKWTFTDRIVSIIVIEAHCISMWGTFCTKYREVGHLHHILLKTIPTMATSATLPLVVLNDVKDILRLQSNNTQILHCSVDQPNRVSKDMRIML